MCYNINMNKCKKCKTMKIDVRGKCTHCFAYDLIYFVLLTTLIIIALLCGIGLALTD